MRTSKNVFGLIGALIPVLFCGGLLFLLNRVRGSGLELLDNMMGPTTIGLAAIGLLFLVLFLWKLRRYLAPPAPPRAGPGSRAAAMEETKSDFDADAAMARYLARRGTGGSAAPVAPPTPRVDGVAVRPGGFGRKGSCQ